MRIFRKEPQQGTNADGKQDLLRHQYEQICQSYYKIEEFRGRLLALWPILGGAAGGIALLASGKLVDYLLPLGIFGGSHYRDSNSKRHRVCIGGHRVAVHRVPWSLLAIALTARIDLALRAPPSQPPWPTR